jgi:twitching motility two-component system response regulator PilH
MATVPTVYFIDDSATMREVIKIAFRRENINVLTSHDAVLALEEIEKNRPDIVITDVIMPVKDGYEVCQFIKTHPELSRIPVILMSGVVNRAVAERAFAVKADELLRKPFQPQDLISRVRNLLKSKGTPKVSPAAAANASAVLSSIFSMAAPSNPRSVAAPAIDQTMGANGTGLSIAMLESPVADKLRHQPGMSISPAFSVVVPDVDPLLEVPNVPAKQSPQTPSATINPATPVSSPAEAGAFRGPAVSAPAANGSPTNGTAKAPNGDLNRPRIEILRLEGLVRKLQAELQAEREYSKALEAHIKTLQESER